MAVITCLELSMITFLVVLYILGSICIFLAAIVHSPPPQEESSICKNYFLGEQELITLDTLEIIMGPKKNAILGWDSYACWAH